MDESHNCELRFDPNPDPNYPHGYWYASMPDGVADASGATIESTLITLIAELHKVYAQERDEVIDLKSKLRGVGYNLND
jgi:hypothetical protein